LIFDLGELTGEKNMTNPKDEIRSNDATTAASLAKLDMKLEAIVIPVSDVERAEQFYRKLGWRQDVTPPGSGVFQFTPHGSACSIQFGETLTSAAPGSAQRTYLIVSDIEAARDALMEAGIEVGEFFHLGPNGPASGLDPDRSSYRSLAMFSDPDGNSWLLQEITTRLSGRIDSGVTSFGSVSDLASAFRRTEAAHGEHEKRTGGQRDANWPDWYAAYMAAEQAGTELPQ
jgi:catechol 2,3-dioxygenase-like lactoylglutathione lyase family enzyme